MTFQLNPLPYAKNALTPFISEETLTYHYGKHHQAYVNKLNALIEGTDLADLPLETLIKTQTGAIFNNAAQVWNHDFYWQCLSPDVDQKPIDHLLTAINETFGSFEAFKTAFQQKALANFGSGWTWLVKDSNNQLSIVNTSNAGNPITENDTPLLTCDVWEHAYYIDYRNDRSAYLDQFWKLVNWEFVGEQLSK